MTVQLKVMKKMRTVNDIPEASKSEKHIIVEDLEASTDEEIEEELEIGNVSVDTNDSKVLESIPSS